MRIGQGPWTAAANWYGYIDEVMISASELQTANFTPSRVPYGGVVYVIKDENGGEIQVGGASNGYFYYDSRNIVASIYSTEVSVSAGSNDTVTVAYPSRAGTLCGFELIDMAGDLAGDTVTAEPYIDGAAAASTDLDCSISSAGRYDNKAINLPDTNYTVTADQLLAVYIAVGASATGTLKFRVNLKFVEN